MQDADSFRFAHFSIDRWIHNVPNGYLHETSFGHRPSADIPPEIAEQSMLRQVYLMDLALFIAAEHTAARTAAALTAVAPDEASLTFLATQTLDEARHFEAFAQRFLDLGLADTHRQQLARDFMTPAWRGFLDLLLEAADKRDFEAGIVGLNVILEGMAFPLYEYEMKYWKPFDPALVDIIEGAFKDEARHVGFGEHRIAHLLRTDTAARNRVQRLVNDLSRKMNDAFDEFLVAFVGFYDLAIADFPERCKEIEIIPGRAFNDTPAEEQVQWLHGRIQRGHRKRLERIGLDCIA